LWHILIDGKALDSTTSTIDLAGEGQRRDFNLDRYIEELQKAIYSSFLNSRPDHVRNSLKNAVVLMDIVPINR
jgi:hypothetical protein